MSDKIKELVEQELNKKTWTFTEIANVSSIVDDIANSLYTELDAKAKLDLVWNVEITDGDYVTPFGQIFSEIVNEELRTKIAEVIKSELNNANVNFNKEDNKNEVPKGSLGGKSSKTRPTSSKRSSEEQE